MTRERFRAGIRATQFAANFMPDTCDEGLTRGAWEKKRRDPKPEPEPEPPFNDAPYYSYQQNSYNLNQQQQQQYSSPQYQTQQPAYDLNLYNSPNNPAGYGGQPLNNPGYPTPYGGGYSPPLAGQNPYGNYHNQQTPNPMGSSYGQGAPGSYRPGQNTPSVPQGQSPFSSSQPSRASTNGSFASTAPPAPRYCSLHGRDRDWSCGECRGLPY